MIDVLLQVDLRLTQNLKKALRQHQNYHIEKEYVRDSIPFGLVYNFLKFISRLNVAKITKILFIFRKEPSNLYRDPNREFNRL